MFFHKISNPILQVNLINVMVSIITPSGPRHEASSVMEQARCVQEGFGGGIVRDTSLSVTSCKMAFPTPMLFAY
ncbi:MAG: hypothetical protein ACD_2C00053G0001, partial [uncultured bacterium (gcode 4)]